MCRVLRDYISVWPLRQGSLQEDVLHFTVLDGSAKVS